MRAVLTKLFFPSISNQTKLIYNTPPPSQDNGIFTSFLKQQNARSIRKSPVRLPQDEQATFPQHLNKNLNLKGLTQNKSID